MEAVSPYLTKNGLEHLKQKLVRLKTQELPQAIEDVKRTAEFGDFSENAEYQEAKARLRRIHAQIFSIMEKIKHAVVIKRDAADHRIGLGSTVIVQINTQESSYEIVGPQESDPTHGRISHVSPLGMRLMGKTVGDIIEFNTASGLTLYKIVRIE